MDPLSIVVVVVVSGIAVYLLVKMLLERRTAAAIASGLREANAELTRIVTKLREKALALDAENARLARYGVVADADSEAERLLADARAALARATGEANAKAAEILAAARTEAANETAVARAEATDARQRARALKDQTQATIDAATLQAARILDEARKRAEEVAGSAFQAMNNAAFYEQTVKAMKNVIEGYGDLYLVPGHSLLDDLAEEFGHTEAGEELKRARERAAAMVRNGTAATCEYVEANRQQTAIDFVLDAFNGKVDRILSRVKHDNVGTLGQEIRDAYTLVNFNGKAFRNARITEPYVSARLDELKWAAVAQELKLQEREEQRRLKEQIREEERVRKECEKAVRDAAKEEDVLRKAMDKARDAVAKASEEQRAKYEQQLADLAVRLQAAEERNQRALSMAQQTKRGHVYVISNVGSFGEDVFKIGMTRRLEPLDRVRELGDSSVPFEFDVHALVASDDAPALEARLHRHFVLRQVNKVNHRKEFFRASAKEIHDEIDALGLPAHWTMAAAAREYRETLAIEKVIQADPAAREKWVRRQLELEAIEELELEAGVAAEA